jgi:putative aminopeptidase FrvX
MGEGPVLFSGGEKMTGLTQAVETNAAHMSVSLQISAEVPSMLLSSGLKGDKEYVCLCLPVKAAYTPSETVSLEDIRDLQKILAELWNGEAQR